MQYEQFFSAPALASKPNPIDAILARVMATPGIISFAVGTPDTALLPLNSMPLLTERAIAEYDRSILQYGLPKGFPPLIAAAQPNLQARGLVVTPETTHISTGGSGALNNACMTLLNPGDVVLTENPTYSPAVKTFRSYKATVLPVESDEHGMRADALEMALKENAGVKLIYLLPTFQNPTGNVMPLKRRKQLVALAEQYDVLIIEDDVYCDLRYRGDAVTPIQALAPARTLYLGSVSKILAPAMRVGLAVIPEPILAKFLNFKHSIDMTTSPYTQALTAQFLLGDEYARHLAQIRKVYGDKMAAMQKALSQHMPVGFTWNDPEGGLFLWVAGPAGFDAEALLDKAIDAGIAYMPGAGFYLEPGQGTHTLRLSIAAPSVEKIQEGIAILGELCRTAASGQ